jgi:hypothetical protein
MIKSFSILVSNSVYLVADVAIVYLINVNPMKSFRCVLQIFCPQTAHSEELKDKSSLRSSNSRFNVGGLGSRFCKNFAMIAFLNLGTDLIVDLIAASSKFLFAVAKLLNRHRLDPASTLLLYLNLSNLGNNRFTHRLH